MTTQSSDNTLSHLLMLFLLSTNFVNCQRESQGRREQDFSIRGKGGQIVFGDGERKAERISIIFHPKARQDREKKKILLCFSLRLCFPPPLLALLLRESFILLTIVSVSRSVMSREFCYVRLESHPSSFSSLLVFSLIERGNPCNCIS